MNIIKRRVNTNIFTFLVMVGFAILLSGCGLLQKTGLLSGPEEAPIPLEEQPYTLNLTLSASTDINPNTTSRASPVQVRIFAMPPRTDIVDISFEEFFDYSGNVMQPRPQLVSTMQPGESKEISLPLNKTQTMLVVVAAYRDPHQTLWKAIATLESADDVSASVAIDATAVTIIADI